jgi:photosynthetic reaction center H subunit
MASEDPDPRGMVAVGFDGIVGGTIVDIWVDKAEPQVRYYELETAGTHRRVLLPVGFCRVVASAGEVRVKAIAGRHFEGVPATKHPEQVTLLEEDRIAGYYGGGFLYADPSRQDPGL